MIGRGRPPKQIEITEVKELTEEEAASLPTKGNVSNIAKIRDSHHMIAKLLAMGLRVSEVALRTGYSVTRISTLSRSPMMKDLIAYYRSLDTTEFIQERDEYYETVAATRIMSARLINDKLGDCEPDDISFRELVMIHSDAADRTGYPKRQIAVNVNLDFAARLDKAVERSKVQRLKVIESSNLKSGPVLNIVPDPGPSKPTEPDGFRRRI
jgi:hypothetical protein